MEKITFLLLIVILLFHAEVFAASGSVSQVKQSGLTVVNNNIRFQILTPSLVRMEYSPDKRFTDSPTIVVLKRDWPEVEFNTSEENGWLIIKTKKIRISYRIDSGKLQRDNLKISWTHDSKEFSWSPGDSDRYNLGGITYSLDGVRKGKLPDFPPGILSKSGYFLLDDSNTPVWNESFQWIEPRNLKENQDWYFFVYGNDYAGVLKEYSELCGRIPMIPRYTLGSWITDLNYEYLPGTEIIDKYRYTDEDVKNIVRKFRDYDIPVDILVLDFAWHNLGWKGSYDWSPIFPKPDSFMEWTRNNGLKVTLNDHPGYGKEGILSNDDSRAEKVRELLNLNPPEQPNIKIDISSGWKFRIDPDTTGLSEKWYKKEFDDSKWSDIITPALWEDHGHSGYDGYGWYRNWITISPGKKSDSLFLILGGVDDEYDLFINGDKIAHHGAPNASVYNTLTWTNITPHIKYGVKNLIALRINDWGGGGGIVSGPVSITDQLPPPGIRFNLAIKKQADVFMDVLHKPLMDQGVAFWWVDGGRGSCEMEGLNSQLWTNHIFYHYTEQQTKKRGFIFSRYGGWGNHRYPSYFTGDTYADWDVLAFQVPFTANGGNVLMPYITHDIGGFIYKDISFDLYARWIQFGVFSPFVRLHSAYENPKDGNARMPWTYGQDGIELVKKYFKLRYSLIPYIYTYCRIAYENGLPIIRPLYLEYPDLEKAYNYPYQYFFGKEILVAPIVDSTGTKEIYLPPGQWIDFFNGKIYNGNQIIKQTYTTEEMPVFVRSGSIIIRQLDMAYSDQRQLDHLIIDVYGRASSSFELYEDDGLTLDYQIGKYAKTKIQYKILDNGTSVLEINPANGEYSGQIEKRLYTLNIPQAFRPKTITENNEPVKKDKWKWIKNKGIVTIETEKRSIREMVKVEIR